MSDQSDDKPVQIRVQPVLQISEILVELRRLHLLAILDTARAQSVLGFVLETHLPCRSLYDDPLASELRDCAPYLVDLRESPSGCLEDLVRVAWGSAWGVFLSCRENFSLVRRHFKQFLMVRTEENEELYFRFYDPRVLGPFLASCNAAETALFFGNIQTFVFEADSGKELWTCSPAVSASVTARFGAHGRGN